MAADDANIDNISEFSEQDGLNNETYLNDNVDNFYFLINGMPQNNNSFINESDELLEFICTINHTEADHINQ